MLHLKLIKNNAGMYEWDEEPYFLYPQVTYTHISYSMLKFNQTKSLSSGV